MSALRYGPLALRKIQSMAGFQPDGGVTFPAGKKVKISFHEVDQEGAHKVFMWKPDREYLHEVFVKAGMSIADFHISYKQDGEDLQLDATKLGIEDFLADHCQHDDPRLKVEWRQASALEKVKDKLNSAKSWLTGKGDATDQAVQDAQKQVEQHGGKIVSSESCGRRFVNHKGYQVQHWDDKAVKGLQQELELKDTDIAPLINAAIRDEGRGAHFIEQKRTGKRITTTYTAYHTVMHGDKIDVIYGKHEESMEVSGEAMPLPSQNCIQYDRVEYSVWPPAHPHNQVAGNDMEGLALDVPCGWRVVDSSQEGFENILKWVVAPYGWHTSFLVTEGPGGELRDWTTARYGSNSGTDAGKSLVQKIGGSRFQFGGYSRRLLIEKLPAASPQLVNNWKRYVQLSAQREWSERLSMPLAVP
ncbi:unnamed protein product [Symbiodinium sp. KB8]|nr:unnamed protein product [Symbiodinium sp. KB8]